jgi:hypothetical protein
VLILPFKIIILELSTPQDPSFFILPQKPQRHPALSQRILRNRLSTKENVHRLFVYYK